jgi:hypothetical protein
MSKAPFNLFKPAPMHHFDYIIFVYDLSRVSTWHDLKKYKEQNEKYLSSDSNPKYFIIGNKADQDKLIDIKKITFFAPHMEISAKS